MSACGWVGVPECVRVLSDITRLWLSKTGDLRKDKRNSSFRINFEPMCVCVCVYETPCTHPREHEGACNFSPQKEVWGDYRVEWWENLGTLFHLLTRQAAFKDWWVCMQSENMCVSGWCLFKKSTFLVSALDADSIYFMGAHADKSLPCSREVLNSSLFVNQQWGSGVIRSLSWHYASPRIYT